MIEQDTIKLLRECDAGVRMGAASIDEVLDHVKGAELHEILASRRHEYERIQQEIQALLNKYKDDGKEPSPIAKGMSWMKTNVKIGIEGTDAAVADLITDGSNMGVKSLYRYLNQYQAADEKSKDITNRLIDLGEHLTADMRRFL